MIAFQPMSTEQARAYQAGEPDAYGMTPERRVSDGDGVPCRHCLQLVPAGAPYLLLAHRPFPAPQPYAETGPIFLCADTCDAAEPGADLPEILHAQSYILRGYGADHRIIGGTGRVVATAGLVGAAAALLDLPQVDYAHVRSASNNCYLVVVRKQP
jgi:Protein of unknown function (DUF1203)